MDISDTSLARWLPDWLQRCAENTPDHLAVKCGAVRWSFADLDQRANRLARQIATLGVQEGSRVALLATNGLPYVACVHALTRLGAILVPLNTRLTPQELCWQLQDVKAMLLLSDSRYASLADELQLPDIPHTTLIADVAGNVSLEAIPVAESECSLRSLIDLNATQVIMYTSGTTGHPKGVIITYGMQWWNAIGSALNLGHQPDDCWLACMPLFHIGGLSILMRSVIYNISVVLHERFEAEAINRAISEDGVTIISVVAVMLQRMLAALDADHKQYPTVLRCVLLGGGPAPRPLLEDCARRAIPVVQTYGLTESCSQAVTLSPADALRKLGSAGRPLPPVQLRIMRDQQPAQPGEEGVIYLKGPTITPGYAERPEATTQAFHDGWLSTGDMGYLDAEGYLYVLDRRSDLIISGGENVYPAEIEAILLAHPDVEEVGVCGRADVQWGQVPVAFIRQRTGSDVQAASLLAYAAERLARYKHPKAIYFVEHLPRNSAGKLVRRELIKLLPV
ncbi:2-succinylbenzoate--CoA ligase [Reticulibacter mediterranei]|uniref:2-succinylbenzoate--CoA ligase n=1 Tax=Reticulibacter mediterranei TaxID=2778369 RepID=A0A8J3N4C4_9CHLR|nr:o-succinylbenzoate--CoA ligase [Reticulibacter mediterranei]GHO95185.1 2-succinylbenzoate--CoA ligase [Reticulibacter mediterranei]